MPVEPVNDTFRTRGSATSTSPNELPGPRSTRESTHTLRQTRVDEALGQRQRRIEGGGAGGLEDDGVAGRQRRSDLVQHQQRRVVERGDRDDHADRLTDREADLVEARALVRIQGQRVAVELGTLERRQPDQVARAAYFQGRLGDRLAAILGAEDRGELRRALVDEGRRLQEDPHPLVGRGAPPDHRAPLDSPRFFFFFRVFFVQRIAGKANEGVRQRVAPG